MPQAAIEAFEKVASGIYLEGLAIDHGRDVVWYSDVIAGGIHGVKPDGTRVVTFNPERMWTGGVMMNADGSVLSTGEGGIMWNNPDTGKSGWLIDTIDGKPVNGINEMAPDGKGGIFFGTSDIEMVIKGEQTRPTRIYRLTADRELIRLADDIGFTNGIMFDPVRSRLYCNDTFHGTWAFDVDAGWTLSNKQFLIEKEDADGMALDASGNLWITGFRSNFFTRLAPGGTRLPDYATPAGSITQIRFGGPDMRDIFFNSVPSDGGDTLKEGGEITAKNSFLFKGRSETPGMKLEPARFTLD
ncbi:SMP-30/gluconolactonase/LRE family protein [Novosphingobium album (ex Hu et al. 2023)]|uniref:SMP-30/gluconolactonase/LRE family protein n=1 Tax=Novosphingobium album (ex Hu et al. 2023) TaxID=2930093 RepID=A0ABT0B7M5_9SPHN|nr:SMP-30/gluconolactonase/LRE family protein [Novosphingobium album (ex Hu et al. 2023)]MCJ2180858.1 SMP-30/gluconolactonase/LRE family protein [Novosphingobium album (ex Hu et al. 2023)]